MPVFCCYVKLTHRRKGVHQLYQRYALSMSMEKAASHAHDKAGTCGTGFVENVTQMASEDFPPHDHHQAVTREGVFSIVIGGRFYLELATEARQKHADHWADRA